MTGPDVIATSIRNSPTKTSTIDELLAKLSGILGLENFTGDNTNPPSKVTNSSTVHPTAFYTSPNNGGSLYYPNVQPTIMQQPTKSVSALGPPPGASSHLNSSVNSLSENFNTCMYPSISVGDGYSIPVTNTGHNILPTPTRSLHLNNVLIIPHIVKNLIFVRQFVRDNNCTIEFDAFGFSVKDFLTRRVLLRCDSTRDLYPVTAPSPIPHAFLVSQHMWYQSLGHLEGEVLRHACQLGKHVKLPFVSSDTVISSCFDIIHSDVWTSPIPSLSGFKYYSPTAAPPTPASPSLDQIHSPVQQPSLMAQHTPVQLQFSPTAVSHQTIIVLDQHVPVIIQNPLVNPNPDSVHPMVTRFRVGTNRPTKHLNLHVSSVSPLPKSYRDAFNDSNWQNAMRDEYTALIKNKTWTLVPRPPDTNIVRCMWLLRHKYLADGTLSRYKARLVANGSTQLEGVDVDDTFSPVVKPGTIRTVLSLATSRHWLIHQLDVKNAFLHGDLSETVYMYQPPGFWDSIHPDYTCLLQRSLYGLKQNPRAWFQRFASYITWVGFSHSRSSFESLLQQIIISLHHEFAMTDLVEILDRAHMVNCNPSRTPIDTESKLGSDGDLVSDPTLYQSIAGSLQYLTFTRPDNSYVVQQVCLHMHDAREPQFSALKRILWYVRGTLDYGLQLFSSSTTDLVAYSDADWASCPTTRHSTSGYCVFLGNNLLSWSSKRQPTLSHSSAEAEYCGVTNAVAKTCWLRNLLRELHTPLSSTTLVYCDNVSAFYLSCNLVQHQRTKHIEIDIHFVRDLVAAGQVRVLHVPSRYQFADIFTKGLPSTLFEEFRTILSVRCPITPTAGEF
ncbi:ribonuclease H-like domain-containing protein [Tanacetum coccineum]